MTRSDPDTPSTSTASSPAARKLDAVVHPVRLRILRALGERPATVAALVEALGDVPQSSVYRHLKVLRDEGFVAPDDEARGEGREQVFALARSAHLSADDVRGIGGEAHVQAFMTYVMGLVQEFAGWAGDRPAIDMGAERAGYTEVSFWATPAEFDAMVVALNAALIPLLGHQPAPGRVHHKLATITFPTQPLTATPPAQEPDDAHHEHE